MAPIDFIRDQLLPGYAIFLIFAIPLYFLVRGVLAIAHTRETRKNQEIAEFWARFDAIQRKTDPAMRKWIAAGQMGSKTYAQAAKEYYSALTEKEADLGKWRVEGKRKGYL